MLNIDVAELKRPIQTLPETGFCGDATLIIDAPTTLFLALFDGAGHGYSANKTADIAIRFLKQESGQDLTDLLLSLHQVLKGTPGGVAGLCRIDKNTGQMDCTGIGDVTIRMFTPESRRFVIRGGVLGDEIINPKVYQTQLSPGYVLMLYSDGVDDRVKLDDFPDFFTLSAYDIARITIDYFSKILDDASVIVLKVKND